MESPRSETQTRYSTPVSDLDDHRDQSGIPALNMPVQALPASRGAGTSANAPEPEFLQVNGPVSRDFEHAITDDEKSKIEDFLVAEHPYGNLTPRRTNSQRLHYSADGITNSRDRSRSSSRSVSPPNSVDAFAQPRRRERANTFGSRAPSDLDGDLHRTVSGGTHRRRPTFTNGSIRQVELNEETNRPEEDVCFPDFDGPTKTFLIDFEELEEFVAESRRGRPNLGQTRQRQSFSSNGVTPKPFLTNSRLSGYIPQITKQEASPLGRKASDCAVDDSPIDIEKSTVPFASKPTRERGLSTVEPTRFSFFSSEIEHTIHAPEFGDLLMPGECFRELFRLPDDGGAWWLDVMNPTTDELEMFQKGFGIHRLTAEDIERQEIREKVELFNQYYFVCFRSFNQTDKESEDYMKPLNVYMVVFREGILTFTYAPSPHAAHVRKRIGNLRNYINLTADWICYAMVYVFVSTLTTIFLLTLSKQRQHRRLLRTRHPLHRSRNRPNRRPGLRRPRRRLLPSPPPNRRMPQESHVSHAPPRRKSRRHQRFRQALQRTVLRHSPRRDRPLSGRYPGPCRYYDEQPGPFRENAQSEP